MEMFLSGAAAVLNFHCFLYILAGTTLGIIFGAAPGLNTAMAVALCLPITYTLSAVDGIAMIIGLFIGGVSGGLITAILLNIPGTAASLATTFDGHPMAEKGQAGKALGVGIVFSFLGTILSMLALIFIAPILANFALEFSSVEYFAIAVFSLTMMATLSGENLVRGLISGLLGWVIAMVGTSPIDYSPRFTFGHLSMEAGFSMISVLTGAFAVSEVMKSAKRKIDISQTDFVDFKIKGFGFSVREFVGQIGNGIRSALIGIAIGILPGIGAGTANIVAYGAAKNSSKHPEKFGTGIIDGVVASEASNNASVGGALIPLLTLGIPGDVGTALMLGGLMIHGIVPGPLLFVTNGELVYSIFTALLIAAICMLVLEFGGMRIFIRILGVKKYILMPIVMILCCVGAYGANNRVFDIIWLGIFGIIGYLLSKVNFPIAPMIIGYVLGPMAETNLRRALMSSNGSLVPFFTSPIAIVFFGLAIFSIIMTIRRTRKNSKNACQQK